MIPRTNSAFGVRFDFDSEIGGENRGDVTHLYVATFSRDIPACSCAIPFEFAVPAQANSYNLSWFIGLHGKDLTRLVTLVRLLSLRSEKSGLALKHD
jgi:hypothetical protein